MSDRVEYSRRLLLVNSASSLATRLLSVTVLIWVQQFLLKRISVEEYSLLPIIFSLMIFVPFITWILTSGIKRAVMVAFSTGDNQEITNIVSSMFPVLVGAGLVLLTTGCLLAWNVELVLNVEPRYIATAQVMLVLVFLLESIRLPAEAFTNGLYVRQRFVLENLVKVGCEVIRLVLMFALLFGISVSVVSVVFSTFIAGLFEVASLFWLSRRLLHYQRFKRSCFKTRIVKELTSFGSWSSLAGLAGMIRKSSAPIILNRLATPLDVACFHLGSLIPNRLEVIFIQSLLGPISPVVVALTAEDEKRRLLELYLRLGRFALWGTLIIAGPFMVHFNQIVHLYVGDTYSAAGTVLFLLLACYPILFGNILHGPLATAKALVRQQAILDMSSAVLGLVISIVLVGYYQLGAVGAAIATFISYGLGSSILLWPFGKGMVGASWSNIWKEILFPGLTPFFCSVASMAALTTMYSPTTWLDIAFNSGFGATIYLIMTWWVARIEDKTQLITALNQAFGNRLNSLK